MDFNHLNYIKKLRRQRIRQTQIRFQKKLNEEDENLADDTGCWNWVAAAGWGSAAARVAKADESARVTEVDKAARVAKANEAVRGLTPSPKQRSSQILNIKFTFESLRGISVFFF